MTTITAMHPRERWLAALDRKSVDHIPFWAKVGGLHKQRWLGAEADWEDLNRIYGSTPQGHAPAIVRQEAPGWEVQTTQADDLRRTVYRSPGGRELVHEYRHDPASASWHPTRFLCSEPEDIELLTDYYRAVQVRPAPADEQAAARAQAQEQATRCPVSTGAGESPLMEWVEHIAGVENAHYLLVDEEELVEALFAAKHRVLTERVAILAASGIYDMIYLIENTSTTLISVDQYRRWCVPHITDYAAAANAHGARLMLHMCGHLKALLPDLSRLAVCGFEAFTAPPVGNTRLSDGREACPDHCLIGGTSAALWLRPQEEIIATVLGDLDAVPHHRGLVLSSAGVMPPVCPPDTVRAVSEAIRRHPVRC